MAEERRGIFLRNKSPFAVFLAGFILILPIHSGPSQANGLVGQILLVAGECPAGYLPADGRTISATEYPELAAVLNEPTEVRFAQIDPIFAGDISPEPTTPDDPTADALPNPIEQVLFKTVDQSGNVSDLTVGVSYTEQYATTDPTQPSTLSNAVNNFLTDPRVSEKFPSHKASDYVIKTLGTDKIASGYYLPDGRELTSAMLFEPEASWIRIDSLSGSFVPLESIKIDELLGLYGKPTATTDSRTLVDGTTGEVTSFAPRYCVASGGDTAPLVEVGLEFIQGPEATGSLVFKRVDVSGFPVIPQGFLQGDIDLKALEAANPGIKRPNVTFRLVNENVCRAYEEVSFPQRVEKSTLAKVNPDSVYPGELRMSGIQISTDTTSDKADIKWGDDFEIQRLNLREGAPLEAAAFAYIAKRDELGRPGFVAADIVDERTIILENRNTNAQDYVYRVQAQCGDGMTAYNVYFDPLIRTGGGGGSSNY
jgi:hypothetical protein